MHTRSAACSHAVRGSQWMPIIHTTFPPWRASYTPAASISLCFALFYKSTVCLTSSTFSFHTFSIFSSFPSLHQISIDLPAHYPTLPHPLATLDYIDTIDLHNLQTSQPLESHVIFPYSSLISCLAFRVGHSPLFRPVPRERLSRHRRDALPQPVRAVFLRPLRSPRQTVQRVLQVL